MNKRCAAGKIDEARVRKEVKRNIMNTEKKTGEEGPRTRWKRKPEENVVRRSQRGKRTSKDQKYEQLTKPEQSTPMDEDEIDGIPASINHKSAHAPSHLGMH